MKKATLALCALVALSANADKKSEIESLKSRVAELECELSLLRRQVFFEVPFTNETEVAESRGVTYTGTVRKIVNTLPMLGMDCEPIKYEDKERIREAIETEKAIRILNSQKESIRPEDRKRLMEIVEKLKKIREKRSAQSPKKREANAATNTPTLFCK